jgi:hypothetical protein
MKIENILQEYLNNGYLLHGSQRCIEGELKPCQACDSSKEEGNLCGVYATNEIAVAIFKAVARRPEQKSSLMGWDFDGNVKKFYGANIALADGYVYILPTDNFKPVQGDDSEFVSVSSILPQAVVKINPKIFKEYIEKNNISLNLTAK